MSLNAAICGLKFFFTVTLDRPELMAKMQPGASAAHVAGDPEPGRGEGA